MAPFIKDFCELGNIGVTLGLMPLPATEDGLL
jgi:hypothetical protein